MYSFYIVDDGEGSEVEMVEMNVDDLYSYFSMDGQRNLPTLDPFGGYPSARIPTSERPRLKFGQDETIFRSSQLNESCWTVDGESPLRTK